MGLLTVSLTSRNAGSVAGRTVGSAVYNMCVQAGSIIASNVSKEPSSTVKDVSSQHFANLE